MFVWKSFVPCSWTAPTGRLGNFRSCRASKQDFGVRKNNMESFLLCGPHGERERRSCFRTELERELNPVVHQKVCQKTQLIGY